MSMDTRDSTKLHPPPPSGVVSDNLSQSSYQDYPAHRPLINTFLHHTPRQHTHQSCRTLSPSKAFPETSSAAILSALRNLQKKIRSLELDKGHIESVFRDTPYTQLQSDKVTQASLSNQTDRGREMSDPSNCNQVLITHLAAAESRCVRLERQLEHMRRMLHNVKADKTNLVKQQVSMDTAEKAHQQPDAVSEHVHLEKLERLEQEYLRLTRTQKNTEIKMRELEMKLQEEEHQRKLIQDKAIQLQTGLEANRILLRSVSPCMTTRQAKEKRSSSQKSSPQLLSSTQPHYRLSLRDVPFVAGTSIGGSHSVRANVQSVLSLLKQHQPHLCNSHVLSDHASSYRTVGHTCSESSSSSSSTSGEELSELMQALHKELRLMSLEHEELMRQMRESVSQQERRELQREQESLLLKMERKGDQISKLYKHKKHIKKLRKEANLRHNCRSEVKMGTAVPTRGRSTAAVKLKPGERSKRNLELLRDMKALQNSLQS
ncbi:centrosomal protein of 57 kDa-like isoform X1 [Solea senegalensis]|uniref:Centrosomal protein of 57 kDa-like isoform X1 n=1 Tax=Solea senegalensis TaxID=28829 RepID=A0AAV6Q0Z9_SOLSE|nr:centrosomal protein of 57 kDa isoform X1 [Solea senegalensis]KAG7479244.1 centrosomal protein of 57 kDa-like isoform X1 [Solea senegalensis]